VSHAQLESDEEGEAIEVVESLRNRLMERAGRQRAEPDAFIHDEIVGDLADDDCSVPAYRAALASLHQHGARATLESLGTHAVRTQDQEIPWLTQSTRPRGGSPGSW
jgi:hypothetical protein